MNIVKATRDYEEWLGARTLLVPEDIDRKHTFMREGAFPFLRATYYRWAQLWTDLCAELAGAPKVLSVGDLHVENFGTWRDAEGRLIWGINDFDEVFVMSYANDLTRLAVSAQFAAKANKLRVAPEQICDLILRGYREGLQNSVPFVLAEEHDWLRTLMTGNLRDPVRFWQKMNALPPVDGPIPLSAAEALESMLPEPNLSYSARRRVAGVGSLGRERFVALASWRGGQIAREAKALVPSAYQWAHSMQGPIEILYQAMLARAVRCPDPFVHLCGHWIVRRLGPDCTRIELAAIPEQQEEARMLEAMGRETANAHAASQEMIPAVLQDLRSRKDSWLHHAAETMRTATVKDWEEWQRT